MADEPSRAAAAANVRPRADRGPAMTSRGFRLLLGILAFVLLYLVALALSIPKIENNLTSSVRSSSWPVESTGVAVTFSGRDGTMTGPLATKDAALAAVTDQWGIRSLDLHRQRRRRGGAEHDRPSRRPRPSRSRRPRRADHDHGRADDHVAATTTTAAQTTTTAAAVTYTDATATISDQTITLSGTVASSRAGPDAARRRHRRRSGCRARSSTSSRSSRRPRRRPVDRAVDGLAAFINAASPGLLEGSGHLVEPGSRRPGRRPSAPPRPTAFNDAVASAASQYGLKVTGTVSPGPSSPSDLQASLTALVGRSGVNFAAGSADPRPAVAGRPRTPRPSPSSRCPSAQVQIVGYTDSDGTPESNLTLSQERADAVKAYLVGRGVPADVAHHPRQGRGGPPRAQRHAGEQGQEPPHRAHRPGELTDPCCTSPERS